MNNIAIATVIAIFFIGDRFFKSAAFALQSYDSIKLIADFLYFRFSRNYFIAFSIPLGGQILKIFLVILIISLTVYLACLIKKNQPDSKADKYLLLFIFLGAMSNLYDRFVYGYVIDYIEIRNISVLNLSDAMISISALILIIKNLVNPKIS